MTPHKAKTICYILMTVTVLLVMMGQAWKWNNGIALLVGFGGIGAFVVIFLAFWRCPHCGKSLGRLAELEYCPYCGQKLKK
jgi:rubrerythrin